MAEILKTVDLSDSESVSRGLRDALARFVTGVTVITTSTRTGSREGLTVNSFSALSLDPPLVLWSLRNNATAFKEFVEQSDRFAVNVLGSHQQSVSRHFAKSSSEKFANFDCDFGLGDCPLIRGSIARFECRLENIFPGGDHAILIGRVERAAFGAGEPLLFHAGTYCMLRPIERLSPLMPDIAALVELSIETTPFF
jgi:flavin reductase (DIM6/NTAB) family NADH-FMN oxidoreductase RutF